VRSAIASQIANFETAENATEAATTTDNVLFPADEITTERDMP